jgi:hypothetical protein
MHDGREPCDRAGSEIVSVGKSAGQNHAVKAGHGGFLVPHHRHILAQDVLNHMLAIVIAVTAWENDYPNIHWQF